MFSWWLDLPRSDRSILDTGSDHLRHIITIREGHKRKKTDVERSLHFWRRKKLSRMKCLVSVLIMQPICQKITGVCMLTVPSLLKSNRRKINIVCFGQLIATFCYYTGDIWWWWWWWWLWLWLWWCPRLINAPTAAAAAAVSNRCLSYSRWAE